VSIAGKLWTAPNTALGLVVGAIAVTLGARAQFGRNALEFLDNPLVAYRGCAAFVLGNTIHYAPGCAPSNRVTRYDGKGWVNLGEHERAHTDQYERWGPFFLVAYLVSWLPFVPPAGNRFEHAADDAAARAGRARD
jgi:membrane protein YqaA with SNARE-associated domain